MKSVETSEESLHRIRENLIDLDRSLGAYPYQNLKQWKRLTCNISGNRISLHKNSDLSVPNFLNYGSFIISYIFYIGKYTVSYK